MSQICGIHQTEMTWKTGSSKQTGKPYAFWSCAQKMPDGSWCNFKAPNPQGGSPGFHNDLNKSHSQMEQQKEWQQRGRCAIAVALITRGDKWGLESWKEAQAWEAWMMTGKPFSSEPVASQFVPPQPKPVPEWVPPPEDNVEIPF